MTSLDEPSRITPPRVGAASFLLVRIGTTAGLALAAVVFVAGLASHFQDAPVHSAGEQADVLALIAGGLTLCAIVIASGLTVSVLGLRRTRTVAAIGTTLIALAIASLIGIFAAVVCLTIAWLLVPVPQCVGSCGDAWLRFALVADALDLAASLGTGAVSWWLADLLTRRRA